MVAKEKEMTITEISGICIVLSSIVAVVWTISNHPTYKYCDETFMRKDLHSQEYNTLLEKIEKLQKAIDELNNK